MSEFTERKVASFDQPLSLECGAVLPEFEIAWESWGTLDADRSNAILLCHTYTSDHHAAGRYSEEDARPGWWDSMIGPGRPLDTERFCVIASNCLGGAAGSTGPASFKPGSHERYGIDFPTLTMADMAAAQVRLIDSLGIPRLRAAIGGCYGGFQVLEWMVHHSERLQSAVVISATPRASVHTVALSYVMRRALMADPRWNGGQYYGGERPRDGIALFSMFGSLFWQDRDLLQRKFGPAMRASREFRFDMEPEFEIEKQMARLAEPQHHDLDPNSMIVLARANDYFDIGRGHGSLSEPLAGFEGDALVVGFDQDWRYPPREIAELIDGLRAGGNPVTAITLDNPLGHGAFLRDPHCLEPALREFLAD